MHLETINISRVLPLRKAIYDFMEDQVGVYCNPHAVEITMTSDSFICIASCWPGEKEGGDNPIELVFASETIGEFADTFGITATRQMDIITPASMLRLYQRGKAEICCYIDYGRYYYVLYFRKQKNKMLAKDDAEVEHEVPVLLETPQQFINYTQQHFQLMRAI